MWNGRRRWKMRITFPEVLLLHLLIVLLLFVSLGRKGELRCVVVLCSSQLVSVVACRVPVSFSFLFVFVVFRFPRFSVFAILPRTTTITGGSGSQKLSAFCLFGFQLGAASSDI